VDAYNELFDALTDDPSYRRYPHSTVVRSYAALRGDTPLVWTVDLDRGRIFYDRDGVHLVYNIKAPQRRPLRIRDFDRYVPLEVPILSSKQSSKICSYAAAPRDVVPDRLYRLVYRIASDYERNWREAGFSVQRDGLHHLAMGLLSCFTLELDVQQVERFDLHTFKHSNRVNPNNLLRWRIWPSPQVITTVSLGTNQIIFTERMDLATTLVHEHFSNVVLQRLGNFEYPRSDYKTPHAKLPSIRTGYHGFYVKVHYVVISIKEIQCFTKVHNKHETTMACTPVETFFSGTGLPSEIGVRWLLNAIYRYTYPVNTLIHTLPIELQEMVLDYAFPSFSSNVFDRAIFAAQLDIGLPFDFKRLKYPFRTCDLTEKRAMNTRHPEYQIRFWGDYVGMSYQLDDDSEKADLRPCAGCKSTSSYRMSKGQLARAEFNGHQLLDWRD